MRAVLLCAAGICASTAIACGRGDPVVSTCDNGRHDGQETGLDCGGGCSACALGITCELPSDCASSLCRDGICALPVSCAELHQATPAATNGPYEVQPLDRSRLVMCDMDTDGGGWTLVAASVLTAPDDVASAYYEDLATLRPAAENGGIWDEMRAIVVATTDVRFSCKVNVIDAGMAVDLSMYDVDWFVRTTGGTDADSCFFPKTNPIIDVPPARRNNLTGEQRPLGDEWDAGDFFGEDSCSDAGDFSVDFDDQGLDSNETDGTDWGRDDGTSKCGTLNPPLNGAWFMWVRE